jgi:hypothetical protein
VLISVADAAKILGLKSRGSVYRKIRDRELDTVPGPDGSPLIERDGLEDRWASITREQKNSPKPLRSAAERSQPRKAPVTDADPVPDFNEERARHEREKRLLAELARQELERQLLRREDVLLAWGNAVNLTRTRLLGVPSTAKQRIPHLQVEDVEVLTTLIRDALEDLAAGEVQ